MLKTGRTHTVYYHRKAVLSESPPSDISYPSQSTYSFRAFKPFNGDLKQPKQTKADQCRPRQTKASIQVPSVWILLLNPNKLNLIEIKTPLLLHLLWKIQNGQFAFCPRATDSPQELWPEDSLLDVASSFSRFSGFPGDVHLNNFDNLCHDRSVISVSSLSFAGAANKHWPAKVANYLSVREDWDSGPIHKISLCHSSRNWQLPQPP